MITSEQTRAGQAIYTRRTLNLYDFVVLGVSNRWIWRCPTHLQLAHYDRHVSSRHLDIGVGTGYYLDKCRFPSSTPRLVLMDLNERSLAHAEARVARYRPAKLVRNVLESIDHQGEVFDSIGLNYLFHCLPGVFREKSVVFDNIRSLAAPGAKVFGATLLQGPDVPRSFAARRLMAFYNRKGVFTNRGDTLPELREALTIRFDRVEIQRIGCGALFSGVVRN